LISWFDSLGRGPQFTGCVFVELPSCLDEGCFDLIRLNTEVVRQFLVVENGHGAPPALALPVEPGAVENLDGAPSNSHQYCIYIQ
jgi:hypothetical protein